MLIKELMTREVRGIDQGEPVCRAAQLMEEVNSGAMPVFHEGKPVGIVTDRDIAVRAVARGLDCRETPVSRIMTPDPHVLSDETDVTHAADHMKRHQIRRLLVHGPDQEIVGIVSLGDLATGTGDQQMVGARVEQVSYGE